MTLHIGRSGIENLYVNSSVSDMQISQNKKIDAYLIEVADQLDNGRNKEYGEDGNAINRKTKVAEATGKAYNNYI